MGTGDDELARIEHDAAADWARIVLELRRRRADHLPDELLGEHVWDLLLVLFIADATGKPIAIAQACREAGGGSATARRWVAVLEQYGLASCSGSADEAMIALTPKGVHAVEACMIDSEAITRGHVGHRRPR